MYADSAVTLFTGYRAAYCDTSSFRFIAIYEGIREPGARKEASYAIIQVSCTNVHTCKQPCGLLSDCSGYLYTCMLSVATMYGLSFNLSAVHTQDAGHPLLQVCALYEVLCVNFGGSMKTSCAILTSFFMNIDR